MQKTEKFMLGRTAKGGEEFCYVQLLMEQQMYGENVKIKQFLCTHLNSDFISDYFKKKTEYWIFKLKKYTENMPNKTIFSTLHDYQNSTTQSERWKNGVKLMILGEMIEHGQEI